MRNFFGKSISLKQKIFAGYVVLILVPLCAITGISSRRSVSILEKKMEQQVGMTCDAINEQFNIFIEDIDIISKDIMINDFVQEILRRSRAEVGIQQYRNLQSQLELEDYLLGIRSRKTGIHSILLYGENTQDFSASSGFSWDVTWDNRKEKWFEEAVEKDGISILTGVRDEKQLFTYPKQEIPVISYVRMIKDLVTFKPLGVLQINIDLNYLTHLGMDTAKEGKISILDDEGNLIFTNWDEAQDAFVVERTSEVTGWKTIYYAPKKELLRETHDTQRFLWMVAGVVTVLGLLFAQLLTKSIMRPIGKLHEQMATVSKGDFDGIIVYEQKDEMGDLIEEFNQMTRKVRMLIQEIQKKEEQRRRTEVDALQARINPHFIYNTLNAVRLTAMMHQDKEVTEQLTAFVYLMKEASQSGGRAVTIRKDLDIITAYCTLMKYRYGNFTLMIQGDKEVEGYLTLPFIIQPLVENAIFHGIAALKRQGEICICFEKRETTVYLEISDNGVGMPREMVKRLMSEDEPQANTLNHVGMKNVLDRLRLYFGERAAMDIHSSEGEGTVIQLEWPQVTMEEMYAQSDGC